MADPNLRRPRPGDSEEERNVRRRVGGELDHTILETLTSITSQLSAVQADLANLRHQVDILTQSTGRSTLTSEEEFFIKSVAKVAFLTLRVSFKPSDENIQGILRNSPGGFQRLLSAGRTQQDIGCDYLSFFKKIFREEKDRVRKQILGLTNYCRWADLRLDHLARNIRNSVASRASVGQINEADFEKKVALLRLTARSTAALQVREFWVTAERAHSNFFR